jgi:phosphatidylinositol kinase/protein kinase (PI-3  family)
MRKHSRLLLSSLSVFTADPLTDQPPKGSFAASSILKAQNDLKVVARKLQGGIDVGAKSSVYQSEDPLLEVANPVHPDKRLLNEEDRRRHKELAELGRDRGKDLSVEAQVDELIKAAICPSNLSKMYIGWAPML